MDAKAEWAEIARVQELVRTFRDPARSAEERVDACIAFFAWLDREGLWPVDRTEDVGRGRKVEVNYDRRALAPTVDLRSGLCLRTTPRQGIPSQTAPESVA
jgi:hypothetical protein